jgi:hypothetical protein
MESIMSPYTKKRNRTLEISQAMAHAVNCWPLTAEARVRAWFIPLGIFGSKSCTGHAADNSTKENTLVAKYE